MKRINENYARELMELHTLGVNGGYSQADVQELARILTGVMARSSAKAGICAPASPMPKSTPCARRELARGATAYVTLEPCRPSPA